ncbi:hypothetical protein P3X46_011178 [Hevea brasiliensis]|uniref:Uncharacterized protein n=2 Tax=Hevea brasiliensis TaxID=3981 RepID=A0A6A6NEN8_HEVBR|nr:protein BIG GRAIN 1-like B [Hevea brasiliensis]KAF2323609.1 hypothetical protein GH714_036309 [Hevea brasiliensis]KAJ9179386.1 hypothetical protein P3X46_011178 [Hevea brasiliensis]
MDKWEKPVGEDRFRRQQRDNPSFSSTLLDAIYRSIDESNGKGEEEHIFYRETIRKKHGNGLKEDGKEERIASLQKACMIEKWMEEKVCYEKVAARRKSMGDFDKKIRKDFNPKPPVLLNSSSSSSESSCGGGFSSSESESFYGLNSSRSSSTYAMQKPKSIRTSVSARPERYERAVDEIAMYQYNHHHERNFAPTQKPKHEGSFVKTKSRALKIYGDLKKAKQPISPGGRLASFLNSLFAAGNAKKANISSSSAYEERKIKSEQTSTCSSASSFSRSCLSKTPSSRGNKLSNGTKRSVRFYPVSVIVDEDSRPCGHKSLYGNHEETLMAVTATRNLTNEDLKFHVMNESRRVEEVTRDLLKNYQKKKQEEFAARDLCNGNGETSEEEEDDDDAASCASSDLFELDNLSAIGIERYDEELPVYETTHLDTNRAIANGLIL